MAQATSWRMSTAILALLALVLVGADEPTTPSPRPTPTPTGADTQEPLTGVVATCHVDRTRQAQVVVCEVTGLPPSQVVRLAARTTPVGSPPRSTWTGSATAGPTGSATVRAALPCPARGSVPVSVRADADGTYRHRQEVTLAGSCRPAWLLTRPEVTRLVAAVLVLATGLVVVSARRRELAEQRATARARRRRSRR